MIGWKWRVVASARVSRGQVMAPAQVNDLDVVAMQRRENVELRQQLKQLCDTLAAQSSWRLRHLKRGGFLPRCFLRKGWWHSHLGAWR
eukprot:6464804-Amphidinium_carterae.1